MTEAELDLLVERLADRVGDRLLLAISEAVIHEPEPWRLIPLREAAQRLGFSERWVRERVRIGELPEVRLGGARCDVLFELADLRAFAAANRGRRRLRRRRDDQQH